MYAKNTLTYIQDNNGFTIMDIGMSYNPQEYPGPDYKPYTVYYTDTADIDSPHFCEESEIGSYNTEEEARAAFNATIDKASSYATSLFFPVYSFNDYLIFTQADR